MLQLTLEKRLTATSAERAGFQLCLELEVGEEVLVLFGPSGAGKSLTLACIAGLVRPDRGRIVLNGRVLFAHDRGQEVWVPLRRRRLGFVQQHYALFPHMTVADNILYGVGRGQDRRRVLEELLARMGLEGLQDRYPHELSGGQQQRVALARALAARPEALLLDEPFAALDQGVRERLQTDLHRLQRERRLPVIYVTHDLADAFALGDRLAVLERGRLRQVDALEEVVSRPADPEVARLVGLRNVFQGEVLEAGPAALVLRWGETRLKAPPRPCPPGGRVSFHVRPEDVKIVHPDRPLNAPVALNLIRARVLTPPSAGPLRTLRVVPAGTDLPLELRFSPSSYRHLNLTAGAEVTLSLRQESVYIFPTLRDDQAQAGD